MDGKAIGRMPARAFFAACALVVLSALCLFPASARAGHFELSASAAYEKSDLEDGYKSMSRRYSASLEYKITPVSGIEFEYSNSLSQYYQVTNIGTLLPYYVNQTNTYVDQNYSVNWVQNLVPANWTIQPYVLGGAGKLKRVIKEEIAEIGKSDETTQSVPTGTAGVGVRIFFLKNFSIKGELKAYVPHFHFADWRNNAMTSAGLSWLF